MLRQSFKIFKDQRSNLSTCKKYGLGVLGINNPQKINYNLSYDELYNHEVKNNEGTVFKTKYGDTFGVDTGKFTGRSPNDKWIVKNIGSESDNNMWWGKVNKPTTPEVFDELLDKAVDHFNTLDKVYLLMVIVVLKKKHKNI